MACASRDFILPCQLLSQSRCLACASRAFVLPYSLPHRMSIKIRVHQNTSSYRRVHQNTSSIATQDRIARRLPYARTQSSGPITALKLIKNCSRLCISGDSRASLDPRRPPRSLAFYYKGLYVAASQIDRAPSNCSVSIICLNCKLHFGRIATN